MGAKELSKELASKTAFVSRPVPSQGRAASQHVTPRRPVCVAGRSNGKRDGKVQIVRAVAAPEKSVTTPPPFEAWNTGAVVKKRTDIKTIMILGAGPIIIGQVCGLTELKKFQSLRAWKCIFSEKFLDVQACEFDYSGTQACKALKYAHNIAFCSD